MSAANPKLWAGLGLTSLPLLGSVAWAAEWRVEPQFEAGVQSNSNVALSPDAGDDGSVQGYSGDIGLLAEVVTPRSNTLIKPRLSYQSYLDRSDLDRVEGFLEFRSQLRALRSNLEVAGDFSRRNELTAELPDAEFNTINPSLPTTPETGDVRIGETRDLYTLRPEYSYRLTERVSVGGAVLYQLTDYSGDDAVGSADYTYTTGTVFSTVALGPRTALTPGVFVGRYEASDIDSESDSVGATLKLAQRWSDRLQVGITASYQQIDITQRAPVSGELFTATAAARRCGPFIPDFLCPRERDDEREPRPERRPRPEPQPMTPEPQPMTPELQPEPQPEPQPELPPFVPVPMTPEPQPAPPKAEPLNPGAALQAGSIEETNSAYGLELSAEYRGTVSRWALRAGRQVTPTGAGGLSNLDQIRVQYDRDLSERLRFTTAVRAFRNRAIAELAASDNNDRDYGRGSLSLTFMVTPAWYVSAGYEYTWQQRERESRSASNNLISLAFGYRGLPR